MVEMRSDKLARSERCLQTCISTMEYINNTGRPTPRRQRQDCNLPIQHLVLVAVVYFSEIFI